MKNFFTKLHYSKELNILEKTLVSLLTPASFGYSLIAETRNFLYKKGILKTYTPEVLTISVGNLTTGGTGKTPITAAIANYLTDKGYKVAILSRGYGSKLNSKDINIISDGETIYFDALTGGDEPVWLAQNCPKTVVLTSSNRIQIAKHAQKMGCTALILDDGFQHQKLGRTINIAVTDSEKQFGNQKVLPAGPLRERIKNLSRANKIIVVNKGGREVDENFKTELHKLNPDATVILSEFKADKIYEINSKETLIAPVKVLAFSAIGQPEQFYNLLKQANFEITKTISFEDHHSYSKEDILEISNQAAAGTAQAIITTEKDAVKIKKFAQENNIKIFALKLAPTLDVREILE